MCAFIAMQRQRYLIEYVGHLNDAFDIFYLCESLSMNYLSRNQNGPKIRQIRTETTG